MIRPPHCQSRGPRRRRPGCHGWPLAAWLPLWLACVPAAAPPPLDPPAEVAPRAAAPSQATPALPLLPPRYAAAAEYAAERAGVALLVIEAGEVVVETGQNGGSVDAPRPLFSGTQSFWGVLAMAAQQDGLLDLDEPVVRTLPEFDRDPWKRDVTVRQLLSFTSGLESGFIPLRREAPSSWYRRALTLDMISRPGERFQYGPSHLFVFGELLRRKLEPTGEDPLDYLTRRLFDPIGLHVSGWARDEAGNPDLPSGAVLRPREWAKFGALLRDRGRVGEEQVVPRDALEACFRGSEAQPAYGLALWLNVAHEGAQGTAAGGTPGGRRADPVFYPGELPDLVIAAGAGNQRLYVSRAADLVVVRFGEPDRTWTDEAFLSRLPRAGPEPEPR